MHEKDHISTRASRASTKHSSHIPCPYKVWTNRKTRFCPESQAGAHVRTSCWADGDTAQKCNERAALNIKSSWPRGTVFYSLPVWKCPLSQESNVRVNFTPHLHFFYSVTYCGKAKLKGTDIFWTLISPTWLGSHASEEPDSWPPISAVPTEDTHPAEWPVLRITQ